MISVCIPFAWDTKERGPALTVIERQHQQAGRQVIVGWGDSREWRKGVAVRDAVERADGNILVVSDCDVWSDQLDEAISAVRDGAGWAIPHRHVKRLTAESSLLFMAGEREGLPLEEDHHGMAGGGIVVLHRDTYDLAPIDSRFVGWGGEDKAWAVALRTLAGRPVRVDGPLWHLWHPPQQRLNRRVGSEANEQLRFRYQAANMQPRAMRALIAEGRAHADREVLRASRDDPASDGRGRPLPEHQS